MKSGVRALGIAESVRGERSTLAGAVVRADAVLDGLVFGSCTVGGTDATEVVCSMIDDLDRPDVRYVLLGAIAPAWYNLFDLERIHEHADRPILVVTFEASEGLKDALRAAFSGDGLERRLERYDRLPQRREVSLETGETVFVRSVGVDDAEGERVVRAFTRSGGRPEPIRVARVAARAGEQYRVRFEQAGSAVE